MPVVHDAQRRAQIVASRDRCLFELNEILARTEDERRRQSQVNRLRLKYGRDEVDRLLLYMTELLNTDPDDHDAFHYQRYHEAYRHFGGTRPALNVDEWQVLRDEWAALHIRVITGKQFNETLGDPLSPKEQNRYDLLQDILLGDSFLWDDITPEDPGQENLPSLRLMMRQFRKRKLEAEPTGSTLPKAPMMMMEAPMCPKHDMPILRLAGKDQCVQEYLEACLVGKRISDVHIDGETGYYYFDDGHILPLLCGCCGQPYDPDNISESAEEILGLTLLSITTSHAHNANGQGYDELVLNLGGPNALPEGIPLAFTAAARLIHPATCAQRKR